MAPRFGTDGLRGVADRELTAGVALALGRAAIEVMGGNRFVIGSDTRLSGPMLEAALTAGVRAAGAEVETMGVVPTPAVAWASADRDAPAAMISASHNPFQDNGIKLFAPGGLKLRDDVEARIEKRYLEHLDHVDPADVPAVAPGTPARFDAAANGHGADGWLDLVIGSIAPGALDGMRLVLDCANGAAFRLGPVPFRALGAEVTVIGDQPDGRNINLGVGSTDTAALQAAVVKVGADAGLALDGDADRLIAVDGRGEVVDGDRVLAVLAADWARSGRLRRNTVVVTVMTNLGFHRAMAAAGIEVVSTAVGDRQVLAALTTAGAGLGAGSRATSCREPPAVWPSCAGCARRPRPVARWRAVGPRHPAGIWPPLAMGY